MLVDEGPARIRELIALGVAFDRGADGDFVKGLEAAHSYPRILHSGGDATGTAIEKALVARLRASDVRVIEHAFLVDLVLRRRPRHGRRPADRRSSRHPATRRTSPDARARSTRMPSCSRPAAPASCTPTRRTRRWRRATASPPRCAPAPTSPTSSSSSSTRPCWGSAACGESFLVSEAVRGEGATLIDENGRRFAFDAHPDGELAPRDVVARAIARQMEAQDGRPVLLDATHLRSTPEEVAVFLAQRFPTIDRAVRDRGLDWAREPIPVTPAAHYLMGGVTTDLDGRTTLPGLYAVGEVARTGVHGANRLASNSLLEGAVFGARAGDAIAADAASGVGGRSPARGSRARRRREAPSCARPTDAVDRRRLRRSPAQPCRSSCGRTPGLVRDARASRTRHPSSRRGARASAPPHRGRVRGREPAARRRAARRGRAARGAGRSARTSAPMRHRQPPSDDRGGCRGRRLGRERGRADAHPDHDRSRRRAPRSKRTRRGATSRARC